MLIACNKNVKALIVYIELLFLACIGKSKPLGEFSFLEQLDSL